MASKRLPPQLLVFQIAILLLLLGAQAALSQTPLVRVEQLRIDPQAHVNEIRRVEGVVERLVNRGANSVAFYLEDDFGHQIMIVPSGDPPSRGARISVTGVVTLDASGDPIITMSDDATTGPAAIRDTVISSPPVVEPPDGVELPEVPERDSDADGVSDARDLCPATPFDESVDEVGCAEATVSRSRLVLGLAGAVVLLVVVGGVVAKRYRSEPVEVPVSELWPADETFDGSTMRFMRPDPTLQLRPGRLEVTGGEDAGEVIRFVGVGSEDFEMTFGRSEGTGASHVQLKEKTVSRSHASIRHREGEWWLQNRSRTNPTVLNDQVLDENEVSLSDGDEIEMGEVTFRFRST